ncbi:sigma-70 family RNA polymerase sigma factor [Lacisediminihabitans changchengi]|uniref:Sigma-70 family RNA polymerase sigma factor n=1 Tax=Lacisediminihabitans changchengi TaxID=2787634 RepID=A0A934W4D9_9MICO|nr:sigma-70 family RNA polymerase sigma factor [Lacisediminihabitans changchengi]MBK4348856.1 sigma-70 family RNA polymerase sigma factor [Lacisediminihabitans changchengi]
MEEQGNPGVTTSDESLVLLARAGDRGAFAELWRRHARSGMRVARQFTSSSEADDLVSEAYARIYQRVLAGGGPDGAFRPYLYTTIRNLAARWGSSNRSIAVEDIGEFEDVVEGDDPATVALDRTLTARAFRSLPERWQSVLWYTEVEGMDPHEVAPIMGLSANGVAALSYRAREGLRKAWLQAHVSDATAAGDCRWTIERLGDHARRGLSAREEGRVVTHLAGCTKCSIIYEEVDDVGSRLALVMLPLILGGGVGGAMLASMSAPGGAMAATAATTAMPPAFLATSAAVTAPAVATGLTAAAVSAPLVGVLSFALAVSGGLAVTAAAQPAAPEHVAAASVSEQVATDAGVAPLETAQPSPDSLALPAAAPSPSAVPGAADSLVGALAPGVGDTLAGAGNSVNGVVGGVGSTVDGVIGGVVGGVGGAVGAILPGTNIGPGPVPEHSAPAGVAGANVALDLSGKGTPGAKVSVQAAGIVYATTTVGLDGRWAVHISALPAATGSLQVNQTLVSLLGIDLLTVPLSVLSNSLGITLDGLGL